MTFDLSKQAIKDELEKSYTEARAKGVGSDAVFIDNFKQGMQNGGDIKEGWRAALDKLSPMKRMRLEGLTNEVVYDGIRSNSQEHVYSIENIQAAFLEVAKKSEVRGDEEIEVLLKKYLQLLPEESQKKVEALKVDWSAIKTKVKYDASPIVDEVNSTEYGKVAKILTEFYKKNVDAIRQLTNILATDPQKYLDGLKDLFSVFLNSNQDALKLYNSGLKEFFDRCLNTLPVTLTLGAEQIEFISAAIKVQKSLYGIDMHHRSNRTIESSGVLDLGDNNYLLYACERNDESRAAFDVLLSKAKQEKNWNDLHQKITTAFNTPVTAFNACQLVALYLEIIDQLESDLPKINLENMTQQQVADVVAVLFLRYLEKFQAEFENAKVSLNELEESDRTEKLKNLEDKQKLCWFLQPSLTRLAEKIPTMMSQESAQSPVFLCEALRKQATLIVRQPLAGELPFGGLFLEAPHEAYGKLFDVSATFDNKEMKRNDISDDQFKVSGEQYVFSDDSFQILPEANDDLILKNFFAKNLPYFTRLRQGSGLTADAETCKICAQALWDEYVKDSRCQLTKNHCDELRGMLSAEKTQSLLVSALADEKEANVEFLEKAKDANTRKATDSASKVYVEALNAVAVLWLHPDFLIKIAGEEQAAEFKKFYRVSNFIEENIASLRQSLAWVLGHPEVLANAIAYYNVNTNKKNKVAITLNKASRTPEEKAGDYIASHPTIRSEIIPDGNDRTELSKVLFGKIENRDSDSEKAVEWLIEKNDAKLVKEINQHRLKSEAKKAVTALAFYPILWESVPSHEILQHEYDQLKNDEERAEFLISNNVSEGVIESINVAAEEKNTKYVESVHLEDSVDPQGALLAVRAFTPLCISQISEDKHYNLSRMFNSGGIDLDVLLPPYELEKIINSIGVEIGAPGKQLEEVLFSITQKILTFLVQDFRRIYPDPNFFNLFTDQFRSNDSNKAGEPRNSENAIIRRNDLILKLISMPLAAFFKHPHTVNDVIIASILPCIGEYFGTFPKEVCESEDFYSAIERDISRLFTPKIKSNKTETELNKENITEPASEKTYEEMIRLFHIDKEAAKRVTFSRQIFTKIIDSPALQANETTLKDLLLFTGKVSVFELANALREFWAKDGNEFTSKDLLFLSEEHLELFKIVLTSDANAAGIVGSEGQQSLQKMLSVVVPSIQNIRGNGELMKAVLPLVGIGIAKLFVTENNYLATEDIERLQKVRKNLLSQFADELDHASLAENISLLNACLDALPKRELVDANENAIENDILSVKVPPEFEKLIIKTFNTNLEFHEKLILIGAIMQGKYNKIESSTTHSLASRALGYHASYDILKTFRSIQNKDDVAQVLQEFRQKTNNSNRRTPIISASFSEHNASKPSVIKEFALWVDDCIHKKNITPCKIKFLSSKDVTECYEYLQRKCETVHLGENLTKEAFFEALKAVCKLSGFELSDITLIKNSSPSVHLSKRAPGPGDSLISQTPGTNSGSVDQNDTNKKRDASIFNEVFPQAMNSGEKKALKGRLENLEKQTLKQLLEKYSKAETLPAEKNELALVISSRFTEEQLQALRKVLGRFQRDIVSQFFQAATMPKGMKKVAKLIDDNAPTVEIVCALKDEAARALSEFNLGRNPSVLRAYQEINAFLNPTSAGEAVVTPMAANQPEPAIKESNVNRLLRSLNDIAPRSPESIMSRKNKTGVEKADSMNLRIASRGV